MTEKKGTRKSAAKTAPKTRSKKTSSDRGKGNNGPFYVLVIIILITVLVLLLNKYYEKGGLILPDFIKSAEKTAKSGDRKEKESVIDREVKPESYADKNSNKIDRNNETKQNEPDKNTGEKDVSLYFLRLDEKSEKVYISAVKRKISERDIISHTFEQLIKGPSKFEQGKGYISAVPANLKIRGIQINGKTAEIDFNGAIEDGAAGDILMKRIQQIVHTATQFDNIDSVLIKINGQRRKTIGGDGLSIGAPLKR